MADFETLHAAEADAREDAGGFPPVELPEEPEPEPEPEAEKELTEEEIKAAEEKAAKKAAKKERKKREPAKELSLEDLQKLGTAKKSKSEVKAQIKALKPKKVELVKPVINNKDVVIGRIKKYTTEEQERSAKSAADAEQEERTKHIATAPKIIRRANVQRWTEMSNKIEQKMNKDPIARPSKKVQLGNKLEMKKKKKKKKNEDGAAEEEEEEAKKPKGGEEDDEDEEVLGFGDLAAPAVDDEKVFGFDVEGGDEEIRQTLANAAKATSIALEVQRGVLVVQETTETHTEEQARLKREAEQRERDRIAQEELAQKQAEAAAAAALQKAKDEAAAAAKAAAARDKIALEKDRKFFAKKMEGANKRRQEMIDERKAKFVASKAGAKKLDVAPLLSLVEAKEAEVETARLARLEAQQSAVTKVDMETKWKQQQEEQKRQEMTNEELDSEGIDLSFGPGAPAPEVGGGKSEAAKAAPAKKKGSVAAKKEGSVATRKAAAANKQAAAEDE